ARTLCTVVRGLVLARGEDERALRGLALVQPDDPAELMGSLASASLVFAARLHALELALLCRAPFVAVATTEKVRSFVSLVERELPRPVPRVPGAGAGEWLRSEDWLRALDRARGRLVEEAWTGVNDVREWLRTVA
ncbi:MAG: hypothetical protein R6U88_05770, partial [Candidatus Bipolaricaulota bacterium]